ncbi:hypothetical protein GMA19_03447 [Paenibacillus polymyxa E681]|uniref:hypothetical protein n=1 Tax=Paenibacillus polymyxa TaxID=1406 RepID=UPI0005C4BE31|nr:hypothetical protein [Paenibacillus polymyxa]ADM71253.2 hypothetical protein PPE_03436 [Paenibacillus polymyxa E681]QNV58276.1 hypothetical protein GE561_03449 [Paenibacillus polymyxa E681]QNV63111.1 hypothetical protein GMA19_03447 [Paenibacillus polymyxa E681]
MTAVDHSCNDAREAYRTSLVGIELDDTKTQMLLSIARKHCKLTFEHSQARMTRSVGSKSVKKLRVYVRCAMILLRNGEQSKKVEFES